jgi:soluble lytic murein transglycosylase-like protein
MMRGLATAVVFSAVFLGLSAGAFASGGIKKIVHPDGRVEFTNESSHGKAPSQTSSTRRSSASATVYKYQQEDGVISFSDSRPKTGTQLEIIKFACYACSLTSTVDWHNTPLNVSAYKQQIDTFASTYSLDPALVRAIIHAESGFNAKAVSPQGAQGLMQLMPGTARDLGVNNAFDTADNIRGGTQYLAKLLGMFQGDIRLAAAAYNAGPNAVRRHGGIPPYQETRTYVERVEILLGRYRQAL